MRIASLFVGLGLPMLVLGADGAPSGNGVPHEGPIPAFSRQFGTACSTCHTAAPKLNVLGEAFRLNGYQMPESELLLRVDDPVALGADEWKEEWPRAIWPSNLPGKVPMALRIQSDLRATRDEREDFSFTYRFPHEVYLLAGTGLGESLGTFLEAEWTQEKGLEVIQAKLTFQDILPLLPERSLNLWLGLQNLYLFTFTDRQIDRAGRQKFRWSTFRAKDLVLLDTLSGEELTAANELELGQGVPALELNGLWSGRLYYAVGLSQGGGYGTDDMNGRKDLYYKVRYKSGGLDLRGRYSGEGGPVLRSGGQLLDHSVILEHFGYFGSESTERSRTGGHRALGVSFRLLSGPLDLGLGYVHRDFDRPWGLDTRADLRFNSLFGKAEYLVLPWIVGSLKADRATVALSDVASQDVSLLGGDETRVMPGVILLLRQNLRVVLEGELFVRHEETTLLGLRRPHNFWMRVDLAF